MASHIGAPSNRKNYHKMKGSGIRTTPENFGKDLENIFKAYTDEVVDAIVEETKDTAEYAAEYLRMLRMPPASEGGSAKPMKRRQWNRYSKSWAVKEYDGDTFYKAIVHNRKHYRLTHLLEYGHATRNGQMTRAFRHIEPMDIYAEDRLKRNIPKIIEKGGKI